MFVYKVSVYRRRHSPLYIPHLLFLFTRQGRNDLLSIHMCVTFSSFFERKFLNNYV